MQIADLGLCIQSAFLRKILFHIKRDVDVLRSFGLNNTRILILQQITRPDQTVSF